MHRDTASNRRRVRHHTGNLYVWRHPTAQIPQQRAPIGTVTLIHSTLVHPEVSLEFPVSWFAAYPVASYASCVLLIF